MRTTLTWRLVIVLVLLGSVVIGGPAAATQSTPVQDAETVAMYRGGPARTGEHPGPGPTGTPEMRWSSWLGFLISSSPAVVDNVVFVGSVSPISVAGGALHAVDAATGEELWHSSTLPGDGFFSSPAVVGGVVYIGSYDGYVIAVSAADGAEQWRFLAEGSIFSSPAVSDGTVYIGDETGNLYALDATSGELRWRFAADQSYERAINTSAAVVDGIVYVVVAARRTGETNWLYALNAVTGAVQWRFAAPGHEKLRGTAAVSGGFVYVVTLEGGLIAVDASDGHLRWQVASDAGSSWANPAVSDGIVFAASDTGELRAVDSTNGQPIWTADVTGGSGLISSPTVAAGSIYIGDADGMLYAVDAVSGEVRWKVSAGSFLSSPAVIGGMVYVGGDDGHLRAFGEATGGTPSPPRPSLPPRIPAPDHENAAAEP